MKLIFDREKLKKNVLMNCNILETKDIISNSLSSIICLVFKDKELKLISNNNGVAIKTVLDIEEEFKEQLKVTVNGVSLKNVINSFKCEKITLEIKEEKLIFKNGKQRYNISYRTDVFFNEVDTGNKDNAEEIDRKYFQYILDKTLFCVSKAKEKPVLSCVWFDEKQILGGDDNRFTRIVNKINKISDVAVPSSVLAEIDNVLNENEDYKLYYYTDGNSLFFIVDDFYFISCGMFEDEYPSEVGNSISVHDKKIILDTQVFLDGVKFISNTINDANNRLFLELGNDSLILYTETDIFDGYNEIPFVKQINTEFCKLQACINYKYVLDILNKIKDEGTDKIMLEYPEDDKPINIRAYKEPFIHSIATIDEKPKKRKKDEEEK